MRFSVVVVSLLLAAMSPLSAQSFGPTPAAAAQREILEVREAAWRAFFTNDTTLFKRVVPDELMAMGWGGGPWQDREQTVASMKEFAASGMKLDQLHFPKNVFQQYGDAVILYTSFHLVLKGANGEVQETLGRGTEIFVRRNGRWIHTGWHLDTIGT
ncbi:MAG: nuclear transport factor 2 family protein [Gemmatimonadetes bacterium]|jgi:hypothetical protein|nr:nuclear transport factor 2 family protein [Gemmatimonadota bacterium]MBK9411471.1 nuclear transport factor 2 family protein [Gemmatimonadota bacterium]